MPGRIRENVILGVIEKYSEYNTVTGHSQCGFMRGKSCLTNLIFFYDKIIHLHDKQKTVGEVFMDFRKALENLSQYPSEQNVQDS